MHLGIPPFGDCEDPEWEVLSADLQQEIIARMDEPDWAFRPCIWLGPDSRCKQYERRPIVCVDFEPGNPVCLDDRAIARSRGKLAR